MLVKSIDLIEPTLLPRPIHMHMLQCIKHISHQWLTSIQLYSRTTNTSKKPSKGLR